MRTEFAHQGALKAETRTRTSPVWVTSWWSRALPAELAYLVRKLSSRLPRRHQGRKRKGDRSHHSKRRGPGADLGPRPDRPPPVLDRRFCGAITRPHRSLDAPPPPSPPALRHLPSDRPPDPPPNPDRAMILNTFGHSAPRIRAPRWPTRATADNSSPATRAVRNSRKRAKSGEERAMLKASSGDATPTARTDPGAPSTRKISLDFPKLVSAPPEARNAQRLPTADAAQAMRFEPCARARDPTPVYPHYHLQATRQHPDDTVWWEWQMLRRLEAPMHLEELDHDVAFCFAPTCLGFPRDRDAGPLTSASQA